MTFWSVRKTGKNLSIETHFNEHPETVLKVAENKTNMPYTITNAVKEDLPGIYLLFEEAILFLKANGYIGWNSYDKAFIQSDIEQGLLFKIKCDGDIACIFSVCYSDVVIWREREKGDALYLHRIVSNRNFAGQKLFHKVLEWAVEAAKRRQLKHVRMDTWADNEKIIAYYRSYGFLFIERYTTPDTDDLPVQHRNLGVALLELDVS